jgi:serine/threonine protein kinase
MRSDFCPNCFADLAPGEKCSQCGEGRSLITEPGDVLRTGYVLARKYKVGRLLGRGGFGATYLAWDINLRVRVAIKEFLPRQLVARAPTGTAVYPYSGSENAFQVGLDQFLSEARNLAQFRDHPGIISVLDFFPENGTGYMVMEYLDGSTLEQYVATAGRLDIPVALRLIIPVADALRACHAVGLIHRDVSPDNIFLTSDGRVRVLDFGAARFAIGSQSTNLSIILKEGYAPFEQYQQNGRQGPWTDIYALTATLYRLVTGRLPVSAADRVAGTPLLFPSKRGGDDPRKFQALLDKGLAIRPEQRYPNVDVFLSAVQSVLQTYGPSPPVNVPKGSAADQSGERGPGPMQSVRGHIGRYELRSVLARTAGSIVYEGWDSSAAQRVVVKAISLPDLDDNNARQERARLEDRVQAARQLTHPNVIRICDYIDTQDSAFIVMEFVDGPTLQQILDSRERFDLRSMHSIMEGILEGLHHGHSCGVIHGDINPTNIMLTSDRQPKIKFPTSRFDIGSIGESGVTTGSAAYMSPEQFMGEKIDRRSDIYSAGVVLYRLITGRCPYEGGLATITNKVLKSPVPKLSGMSLTTATELDQVVMRAMAKRRDQRFRSAAEFSAVLQAALRPGTGHRSLRPPRPEYPRLMWDIWGVKIRQNHALMAAAIMVVAATGGAAVWSWLTAPSPLQPPLAGVALDGKNTIRAELPRPEGGEPLRDPPLATTRLANQAENLPYSDSQPGKAAPGGSAQSLSNSPPNKDVRDEIVTAPPSRPSPPRPPTELRTPPLPNPRADQNPAQPVPSPSPQTLRTPNPPAAVVMPPPSARTPGGTVLAEPGFGPAQGNRPKTQSGVRSTPEVGSLEEALNRLRNEGRLPALRSEPDSPRAPTPESPPQPPPTYITTSTSVIGLTCQTVTADSAQQLGMNTPRGLRCIGVTVGSAAAQAGIRSDDVLLTINGSELRDLASLKTIANGMPPGRTVPVELFRGGRTLTVNLALDQLRR